MRDRLVRRAGSQQEARQRHQDQHQDGQPQRGETTAEDQMTEDTPVLFYWSSVFCCWKFNEGLRHLEVVPAPRQKPKIKRRAPRKIEHSPDIIVRIDNQ